MNEIVSINVSLQPKERQLLALMESGHHQLIGYGGARGGAKSHAARTAAVLRRIRYPGTSACVFRRTYDQLWQQHIQPLAAEWPELYTRYWSAENKSLMLPGRSVVMFRYADTFKDILEFKGKEYGDLFIDEATDLDEQSLSVLYTCCRMAQPPRGFHPTKVLTFNPGGVGHSYVKRLFIDNNPTPAEARQNPVFIQSHAWDNVEWVRRLLEENGHSVADYYSWDREKQIEWLLRSDYGRELDALPENMKRAWLYGDWDVFMGQVFSEFRRDQHVCDPFLVPSHWRKWGSNDPGYASAGVWYCHAADEHGRVYTYREFTFRSMPYSEQARRVAAETEGEKLECWVTGMDAFNPNPETGKSLVNYYAEGGLTNFRKPVHGRGSRAAMAATVHEYLKIEEDGTGVKRSRWRIFSSCRKLIETLPMLLADENQPECVADCDDDHWYQAAGYGLQHWHATRSEVVRRELPPMSLGALYGTPMDLELRNAQKAEERWRP